jgi:hypothetical protein
MHKISKAFENVTNNSTAYTSKMLNEAQYIRRFAE